MGRVTAISGGSAEDLKILASHAVELSGKEHANVLYIGTASTDSPAGIESVTEMFGSLGCKVQDLSLTVRNYPEEEMDALLTWADVIYVGGGNTVFMMKLWKQVGLDQKLRRIYQEDTAVLSGISAGAICWFDCGHSDSESFEKTEGWNFIWAEGMLGFFPQVYCPHYNEPGRDSFDEMLKEKKLPGFAMENGTAFVENGQEQYFIRSNKSAKAYRLEYLNGELCKQEVDFRVAGETV